MKKRIITLILIIFTSEALSAETIEPNKLSWMIGQIVTTKTGAIPQGPTEIDFFSTGFVVKTSSRLFFITTAHTINGFWRKYGRNQQILILLPNVPSAINKIYKAGFLFAETTEDAAVLSIEGLQIEGEYETPYASPRTLDKDTPLIYMGYSAQTVSETTPHIYHNRLLSCAIVRNDRSNLGCSSLLPMDTYELYSTGELSSVGLSGSPVFAESSMTLIGIIKAIGNYSKDDRGSAFLGVENFNVIRPLDKTITRIRAMHN